MTRRTSVWIVEVIVDGITVPLHGCWLKESFAEAAAKNYNDKFTGARARVRRYDRVDLRRKQK